MKNTLFILSSILVLASCTAPEKEETGQIMEYAGDEEDSTGIESVEEYDDEDEFETKYTQVIEANIGLYQELAIMVLKEQGENKDGTINITGYYFYVKHQKNLDLDGVKDPVSGKYVLTESYKGETTGYMEFIPGVADESFWAPASDTEDEQALNAKKLTGGDPYEMTMIINHNTYEYEHEIQMYNGEDWDNESVTDVLKVTWINEEYMAFDLNVIRNNAHLGSVNGVAKVTGDKAEFNKDAESEWEICQLEFDITEKDITVIEKDCSAWHGANAYFDGTYTKK
mgnify:CR=1 FL=1